MGELGIILTGALSLYALAATVFIILENRRPQATLAWMLVFFFAPGIGLLVYIFFGRDRKAFSRQSRLLMQDLEANARPLLSPLLPARTRRSRAWKPAAPAAEADDARAAQLPLGADAAQHG